MSAPSSILWQMHVRLRDLPELYNYVEVALWPALGVVFFLWGLRRRGSVRRDAMLAAITLLIFGASDWFEANTGNEWWHPWWLLLWKAACVLVLLGLLGLAWKRRARRGRRTRQGFSDSTCRFQF